MLRNRGKFDLKLFRNCPGVAMLKSLVIFFSDRATYRQTVVKQKENFLDLDMPYHGIVKISAGK
jgi:hypothetical protein